MCAESYLCVASRVIIFRLFSGDFPCLKHLSPTSFHPGLMSKYSKMLYHVERTFGNDEYLGLPDVGTTLS